MTCKIYLNRPKHSKLPRSNLCMVHNKISLKIGTQELIMHDMNVMKCEPDPDGESFLTSSDNESQLNDMKEDISHVLKLPVTDSENESLQLNVDTIKVEHKKHLLQRAVDTLNEGDVADNRHDLSVSPECQLIKCETEVITDFIKSEPNSCCEIYVSPSHSENEMTGAKEEEDPLLLAFPLMQTDSEVVMDPGNGGGKPSRSQPNSQSEDHLRSTYISASELGASQNQDILRRARNAERKRRSRQSQQANETLQEAVLRRSRHAEEVRKWYQLRQASESPQEAALRRARHAEIMRQRRQSQRESETSQEAALRRAQHAAEVRRWRQSRQDNETPEVTVSRRAQNAEGVRRWRQSQRANETPQVAASRRAQHAEVMRQWRQFQRVNETPEDAALRRAQQTDQVLIMNSGNDGENFNWSHLNRQSERQLKSGFTSPVQLSECQNQLLMRRARNAERKRRSRQARKAKETLEEAAIRRAQHAEQVRRWRQSRLANETPQVAASRRAQHAEIMRQWRQSQRANETPEEAASRRAQQTAQVRRSRAARRPLIPNHDSFIMNQEMPDERQGGLAC